MQSFIHLGLISLSKILKEIDIITNYAKSYSESGTNEELYKVLCRSAQVLLSAHFEGYLKDLVKNALEDINQFSDFKSSNSHLKRRYCEYFIGSTNDSKTAKRNNSRILELITVLDNLETKFNKNYLPVYKDNNNPKATYLDNIAEQFGVTKFFEKLKKSNLDIIFSNTTSDNLAICETIKDLLLSTTENFPYSINLDFLEIDSTKTGSSLWDTFLSDLLKRRHDIAHGSEVENSVGHTTIEQDKLKIEILIYTFTAFICIQSNPVSISTD